MGHVERTGSAAARDGEVGLFRGYNHDILYASDEVHG